MGLKSVVKAFLTPSQGKKTIIDAFGDVNARWYSLKDNESFVKAYLEVPELYSIITDKAKQTAKGIWRLKDTKSGDLIESDRFLDILRQPNPLMSGAELLKSSVIDYGIFGNFYNFLLTPINQKPTPDNVAVIYRLDARYTYPQATGKIFYQTQLKDIVAKYVFDVRGQSFDFKTENICHVSNSSVNFLNGKYLLGQSNIEPLKWAISNIKEAYEARNVYITKRGAFGIFSNQSQGEMGMQPMEDKEELQKSLNRYGLKGRLAQFILTNSNLKWTPISIPTKDLELYKEVRESVIAISQAYNYPSLLLGYPEGSTFSNVESETKRLYTDGIIPEAQHIASEINRTINAKQYNKEYFLDYSHIESLQKDKKVEAQRQQIAVNTIIKLNEAIQNGNVSYDSAIEILVNIVGMKQDEARGVLSEMTVKPKEDE